MFNFEDSGEILAKKSNDSGQNSLVNNEEDFNLKDINGRFETFENNMKDIEEKNIEKNC